MGTSVYIEGPYGGNQATLQPLSIADTVLCLVGGIGITNALGFIQEYTSATLHRGENQSRSHGIMKRAKRFIFAWSAREMALTEFVKEHFLAGINDVEGVECSFWCTGLSNTAVKELDFFDGKGLGPDSLPLGRKATVKVGRMDIDFTIRSSLEVNRHTTILVCGPDAMGDEATRHVVDCVKDGFRVELIEESYAW